MRSSMQFHLHQEIVESDFKPVQIFVHVMRMKDAFAKCFHLQQPPRQQ